MHSSILFRGMPNKIGVSLKYVISRFTFIYSHYTLSTFLYGNSIQPRLAISILLQKQDKNIKYLNKILYMSCIKFLTFKITIQQINIHLSIHLSIYSPFHKTLPKSSSQMHWISVRFYEMGDTSFYFYGENIFCLVKYSQFHKTLPKCSLQMHWTSVRFNEMGGT